LSGKNVNRSASQPYDENDSVRHLIELGYDDPDAVAAREAAVRRQLEAEFQDAAKRYSRGDIEEAGRLFEKLAVDDPDWTAPRQVLAEIYYRAGRLADAQLQLGWLAEHGVEHPRLALIAGAVALSHREFIVALEALDYAAFVEPNLPSVHTLLGMVLLRLGQSEAAQSSFTKAIERNPADVNAYDGMAAICIQRGEFEEAANFALEALAHDMQLFRAHYHLGVALSKLNRLHESIAALETAAKMDVNSAAPYYWLSRIAQKQLADPHRAAEYLDKGRAVIRRRPRRFERGKKDDIA
jgi:tetratricopeptide (TPR) repeat protein